MALEKELDALPSPMRRGDAKERRELARQRLELLNRVDALDLTHPGAPPRANVLVDSPRPKDSPVFIRGEAENKGRIVPRQFLECLAPAVAQAILQRQRPIRTGLALASKNNPLTAGSWSIESGSTTLGKGWWQRRMILELWARPPLIPNCWTIWHRNS
jgi:hypothetical protein